ncbi:MAG: hypothetical protein HWE08_08460 [Alphaproteobacteria bacterium]|nr:hypothetical protein [Alphaproteobacteria bacterium]
MTMMLQTMPVTPGTRREGMEIAGVVMGSSLIRQSDHRLPELSRRQRRINRQRRLN